MCKFQTSQTFLSSVDALYAAMHHALRTRGPAASPLSFAFPPLNIPARTIQLHLPPHGLAIALYKLLCDLVRYAREASWKEDHRRDSNGLQGRTVLVLVTRNGSSIDFCGYWQRSRPAA
jgi:hypothetical protein